MTTLGLALAWLHDTDDDFASEWAHARDRTSVLRPARGEDMIRDPAMRSEAQAQVPGARRTGDRSAPRTTIPPG
ncbi:MAG: hypothetical protein LT106_14220 [Burkholderiaceae bacterium]|nr:hypothetical protein [Burkholderiaceae bacterium]